MPHPFSPALLHILFRVFFYAAVAFQTFALFVVDDCPGASPSPALALRTHAQDVVEGRNAKAMPAASSWHQTSTIQAGVPRFVGALLKKEIGAVVAKHAPEISSCIQRALLKKGRQSSTSKFTLIWVVASSGFVQHVNVKKTSHTDPFLEHCLKRSVVRWRFPPPKTGGIVVVFQKYSFSSTGRIDDFPLVGGVH